MPAPPRTLASSFAIRFSVTVGNRSRVMTRSPRKDAIHIQRTLPPPPRDNLRTDRYTKNKYQVSRSSQHIQPETPFDHRSRIATRAESDGITRGSRVAGS